MSLLGPAILCSLELHITPTGRWQYFVTPRELSRLAPEARLTIVASMQAALDALAGDLGVVLRYEPTLTKEQARQVLD